MLLIPSFPPCVSMVWGCLLYRSNLPTIVPPLAAPPHPSWDMHCAVWVSGMLCAPSSQGMESPPALRPFVLGLLVGWLLVVGLLGWLLGWLVGCWLIGSWTTEFWWLVGLLVGGWLVAWLVGCWLVARVYVCVLPGHMLCAVVAHGVCV